MAPDGGTGRSNGGTDGSLDRARSALASVGDRVGWCCAALAVLLIGAVAFGWCEHRRAEREQAEAERRDSVAARAVEVADSLGRRNEELLEAKAEADARAREDSAALAEARRELERERARRADATDAALADADSSARSLGATLGRVRRRAAEIAPSLLPALDTAEAQLTAHVRADSGVVAGFRRQMELQAEMLANADSMARLNHRRWRRAEVALDSVVQERDSLRAAVGALSDARDAWRDAARRSLLERILGDGLQETAGIVVSGVAAWRIGDEALLGWTLGRAADAATPLP